MDALPNTHEALERTTDIGPKVAFTAMNLLIPTPQKSEDLIFRHLSGLMISVENLRLMNHASVEDK